MTYNIYDMSYISFVMYPYILYPISYCASYGGPIKILLFSNFLAVTFTKGFRFTSNNCIQVCNLVLKSTLCIAYVYVILHTCLLELSPQ